MSDIKTWQMWILVFSWKLKIVKGGGRLICRVVFYSSKYGIYSPWSKKLPKCYDVYFHDQVIDSAHKLYCKNNITMNICYCSCACACKPPPQITSMLLEVPVNCTEKHQIIYYSTVMNMFINWPVI
jgi:hypothetical protein